MRRARIGLNGGGGIAPGGFASRAFARFSELRFLNREFSQLRGELRPDALHGLRKLRTLCLRACEAGDAAMAAVATLPKLADLDLGYTEVGDGGLYSLASLGSLTSLSLDSCKLGNAGLRGLRAFPRLTSLDLSDIDVPLLSTEWVASLTSLTTNSGRMSTTSFLLVTNSTRSHRWSAGLRAGRGKRRRRGRR